MALLSKYTIDNVPVPPAVPPPAPGTIEFTLCLAGAVSAGAYTAGVLDFLIQSLDAWQAAKAANTPGVPQHSVTLKGVSGASAGGMNAVLLACAQQRAFPAVTTLPPVGRPTGNPFYDCWVTGIDAKDFFSLSDLTPPREGKLTSFLNCKVLDDLVQTWVYGGWGTALAAKRGWFAATWEVSLTTSNLDGIPYYFPMNGANPEFLVRQHADVVRMAISINPLTAAQVAPDAYLLQPPLPGANASAAWTTAGDAALATAAFPVALKARLLHRRAADYESKVVVAGGKSCPIDPLWKSPGGNFPSPWGLTFDTINADGGCMDNEPFDLAHFILAGYGTNAHDADAQRMVVMIEPFPNSDFATRQALAPDLLSVAGGLLGAWKYNARFSSEIYGLALNESYRSRYLIVPERSEAPAGDRGPLGVGGQVLASGSLDAFSGFFSELYRRADFQLGRRNCQRFLMEHFTAPSGSPGVTVAGAGAINPIYLDAAGAEVQIIPLVGAALRTPIPVEPWPSISAPDLAAVCTMLEKRFTAARDALKADYNVPWYGGGVANLIISVLLKKAAGGTLTQVVTDTLRQARL